VQNRKRRGEEVKEEMKMQDFEREIVECKYEIQRQIKETMPSERMQQKGDTRDLRKRGGMKFEW